MAKTLVTVEEEFFPGGGHFEYTLQALRSNFVNGNPAYEVIEVREGPKEEFKIAPTLGALPSIEVVLRIPGLHLRNPATGKALLNLERFKAIFLSWPMMEAYWKGFAQYVADSIPADSPEVELKEHFGKLSGAPSTLPPRADLVVFYRQTLRQLKAVKKWVAGWDKSNRRSKGDRNRQLLEYLQETGWWWSTLAAVDGVPLEDVVLGAPREVAKALLARWYSVSEDAVHSRMFRRGR